MVHLRWRDYGSIMRNHPLGVNRTACGLYIKAGVRITRKAMNATCAACRNEAGVAPVNRATTPK